MDTRVTQLIEILEQIIHLLESDGEDHWRQILIKSNRALTNSDGSGLDALLSMYGGMGSFSDFVIGQLRENQRFVRWKDGHKEKAEELRLLRSKAYSLATDIRRTVKAGEK